MVSGGSTRIRRAALFGRFVLEKKPKMIALCRDFIGFTQSQQLKFAACIKISYLNMIPPPTVYVRKCFFILGFGIWKHWRHTAPFWKEILAKYSSVGEEEEEKGKKRKKKANFHREFMLNDKTIHHTLLLWIFSGWLPPQIQSAPFYLFFYFTIPPAAPMKTHCCICCRSSRKRHRVAYGR